MNEILKISKEWKTLSKRSGLAKRLEKILLYLPTQILIDCTNSDRINQGVKAKLQVEMISRLKKEKSILSLKN